MRDEDSLMYPPLEDLLKKIPDKYALVLTATKRAKHIIMQNRLNPIGIEMSKDNRKPLSIALREIVEGSIDQSDLDLPETLLDDYMEDDAPVYVDMRLPEEETPTTETEVEFAATPPTDETKDVVDDLADVDDIPELDLESDD